MLRVWTRVPHCTGTAGPCGVRTPCASGGPEVEQMTAARMGAPWRLRLPVSVQYGPAGGGVVEERASSSGSRTLLLALYASRRS